ncbi:hypothetical protein [Crocosphaera watsonii]|uniref:hypothetical protein n=1 Tax=Crocosphaera watsonii TaxID=263511 RepID=UPI0030DB2968
MRNPGIAVELMVAAIATPEARDTTVFKIGFIDFSVMTGIVPLNLMIGKIKGLLE